jgi:hypothetical protein
MTEYKQSTELELVLPSGRKPFDKLIENLRVTCADPDPHAVADSG